VAFLKSREFSKEVSKQKEREKKMKNINVYHYEETGKWTANMDGKRIAEGQGITSQAKFEREKIAEGYKVKSRWIKY